MVKCKLCFNLLICVVVLSTLISIAKCREVRVKLAANWPQPTGSSITAQVGEMISDFTKEQKKNEILNESFDTLDSPKSTYFSFVEQMCQPSGIEAVQAMLHFESGHSDQGDEDADAEETLRLFTLSTAQSLVPKPLQRLLSPFLSAGLYLPAATTLQAFSDAFTTAKGESPCGIGQSFAMHYPSSQILCNLPLQGDFTKSAVDIWSDLQPWDHAIVSNTNAKSSDSQGLILYGPIGSKSFCSLYQQSIDLLRADKLDVFAVRPGFPGYELSLKSESESIEGAPHLEETPLTSLSGYGVFLDIKNMEYKNVDDEAKDKDNLEKPKDDENAVVSFPDEEVAGINFKTLQQSQNGKNAELRLLRDSLLQLQLESVDTSGASTMKSWRVRDFGLQGAQLVLGPLLENGAADSSIIKRWWEVAGDFPSSVTRVSAVRVQREFREAVNEWHMKARTAARKISDSLCVAGRCVSLSSAALNFFGLIDMTRKEFSGIQSAKALLPQEASGIDSSLVASLWRKIHKAALFGSSKATGAESDYGMELLTSGPPRVDVSKGAKFAVAFINNLEKDSRYMGWPRSISQLAMPSWQLHTIARNLYTLVSLCDPFTIEGAGILSSTQILHSHGYPIRFGLSFVCDDKASGRGKEESAVSDAKSKLATHRDFCRIFSFIQNSTAGVTGAADFAFGLADDILENSNVNQITKSKILKLAESALSTHTKSTARRSLMTSLTELLDVPFGSTDIDNFISNSTAYVRARGLPANSAWLNGQRVSLPAHISVEAYSSALMPLLGREQAALSALVRTGELNDKVKSIFSYVLSLCNAQPRYHRLLAQEEEESGESPEWISRVEPLSQWIAPRLSDHCDYTSAILSLPTTSTGFKTAKNAIIWANHLNENSQTGNQCSLVSIAWRDSQSSLEAAASIDSKGSVIQSTTTEASFSTTFSALVNSFSDGSTVICEGACVGAVVKLLDTVIEAGVAESGSFSASRILSSLKDDLEFAEVFRTLSQRLENADYVTSIESSNREANSVVSGMLRVDDSGSDSIVASVNGRIMRESSDSEIEQEDLSLLAGLVVSKHEETVRPVIDEALDVFYPSASEKALVINKATFAHRIFAYCGNSQLTGKDSEGDRTDIAGLIQGLRAYGVDVDQLMRTIFPAPIEGEEDQGDVPEVYVVVNPLSVAGQRAAGVVDFFVQQLRIPVTVIFTPYPDLTEFPLTSFYRFVGPSENGRNNEALFRNLPHQHTLTVRTDVPDPWNVQAYKAQQDTDNLRCSAKSCGDPSVDNGLSSQTTRVQYMLKSLLVSGQCLQTTAEDADGFIATKRSLGMNQAPPNGLQLTLSGASFSVASDTTSSSSSPPSVAIPRYSVVSDTLVMQNLGYFQLQTERPGVFSLGLADGRASDLYTIYHGGSYEQTNTLRVASRSFTDEINRLVVVKRRGLEHVSLLDDQAIPASASQSQQSSSLWNMLSSSLFGQSSSSSQVAHVKDDDDNTIHIFSLATGQLYERLLRIMMLSVTRRASRPVKFWLLENYLSPSFKRIADSMARVFNFKVAYVTYKWPHWLRQQTQQQRIIWGYKILFLDVLFPLNLKKVIYVDADQVVRADLAELWDLDMQGLPYGYTPFCTSREETLGFQFWRSGYWREHLQGRPYHISALYVVDLLRFRRYAVGDSLRAIYDQLSRDPNSLANLDQDLPNYAQHQVPIFSLPQHWLWCESWCSDDSKAQAKTIDLCNNPLHKEPKLDMARRVISGSLFNESWVQLDEEIKVIAREAGFGDD